MALHEVNRFPNGPVRVGGALHWDVLGLYRGVLDGLRAAAREAGALGGVGIDSWAVDYGLLDADGALVGNPFHYRDARTDGVPEKVFATIPAAELYARTGLQVQPFNTVFQLVAAQGTAALAAARRRCSSRTCSATGSRASGSRRSPTRRPPGCSTRRRADLGDGPRGAARHRHAACSRRCSTPARCSGTCARTSGCIGVGAGVDRGVARHRVGRRRGARSGDDFAYISCGTWSLVGLELERPVLTEDSRAANFTNEAGVDGTVRYLRNVMGLWVLQESIRTWNEAGLPADLPDLLAAAARVPALTTVVDLDGPAFLPPGDMPARIAAEAVRTGQTPPQSQAETVRCILDSLALAYRRAVRQASALAGTAVPSCTSSAAACATSCSASSPPTRPGCRCVAGPVEGAALGNVLVQARAAGVLSGGLRELRAVGARGLELRRYEPGATGGPTDRQWRAAAARIGPVDAL